MTARPHPWGICRFSKTKSQLPDKCPGGGGRARLELIESLEIQNRRRTKVHYYNSFIPKALQHSRTAFLKTSFVFLKEEIYYYKFNDKNFLQMEPKIFIVDSCIYNFFLYNHDFKSSLTRLVTLTSWSSSAHAPFEVRRKISSVFYNIFCRKFYKMPDKTV